MKNGVGIGNWLTLGIREKIGWSGKGATLED